MRRYVLRGLRARALRTALTALAVVLGVAMISGTYVLTDTIDRAFGDIFSTANAGTDVVVAGRLPGGFSAEQATPPLPQALVERVRGVEGVAQAAGGVFGQVSIRDRRGERIGQGPPNFADSVVPEPFNTYSYVQGRAPRADGEVALDQQTATDHGFRVGDRLTVVGQRGAQRYRVVGVARFGEVASIGGAAIAIMTLPEAQRATGREGQVDQIALAGDEDTTPAELRNRVRDALQGQPVTVRTGEEQADRQASDLQESLGFLRTGLLVFGFIALFVGAFVIYNTFTITVAQRTRELALLRTLGASRRQVLGGVVLEAALVGLFASIVGLVGGLLLAPGLTRLFEALGADLPGTGSVVEPRTVVVALLVGLVTTVLASLVPALRATRIAPVVALREGVVPQRGTGRLRLAIALVLGVVGVALLVVGLTGAATLALLGAGAALVFLAVALLSPQLVRPLAGVVGRPLQRVTGITGLLARENVLRNPARTAVTAAALMIGVALVAFVAIFAAGLRGTIDRSVDESFAGDLTVQNQDGFSPLPAAVARDVRGVEGVDAVSALRFSQAQVPGVSGTVPVIGIDPASAAQTLNLELPAGSEGVLRELTARGAVLVDRGTAVAEGRSVGDRLPLLTPSGRRVTYTIAGFLDEGDFSIVGGGILAPNERVARDFGDREDTLVFVSYAPGAQPEQVRGQVERLLDARFPNAEALDREEFKDEQSAQVNQLLLLVYVLLALSVLVSIFGIVNTLALSTYERTRELGLLRAIGTSRRQVRAIVRQESVITSLIGAVLGVVLGVLFALLVSRPLEAEGFTLTFPVATLALLLVLAALFGVLAAIGPARRAARLDVLRALAYE
jgi:putative ABC transport system permease protein